MERLQRNKFTYRTCLILSTAVHISFIIESLIENDKNLVITMLKYKGKPNVTFVK